jgi:hypothetical protein
MGVSQAITAIAYIVPWLFVVGAVFAAASVEKRGKVKTDVRRQEQSFRMRVRTNR